MESTPAKSNFRGYLAVHICNLRIHFKEFQKSLLMNEPNSPLEEAQQTYYWRDTDVLVKQLLFHYMSAIGAEPSPEDEQKLQSKITASWKARKQYQALLETDEEKEQFKVQEELRVKRWEYNVKVGNMVAHIEDFEKDDESKDDSEE